MRIFRTLRGLFTNQNFVARSPESFFNSICQEQTHPCWALSRATPARVPRDGIDYVEPVFGDAVALEHQRQPLDRGRDAAAVALKPPNVHGDVSLRPRMPGSTLTRQGTPFRVLAPQRGRSLRLSGDPSPASPSSAMRCTWRQWRRQDLSRFGAGSLGM